jgi:hypothetical protein
MSSSSAAAAAPVQLAGFTEEQLRQFVALVQSTALAPRPKIKPPPDYKGDRKDLRQWLATLTNYFRTVKEDDDEARINYTKSLLRDAAAKWITPYTEGIRNEDWNNWDEFVEKLKQQFGDVDAENTARTHIENMRQGNDSFTKHWNEFRIWSTEANYDDKTMQRLLLRGISPELLKAWGQDNHKATDVDDLANWAIEKENRINFVAGIQGKAIRNTTPTRQETYQSSPRTTAPIGDPMELDATRRKPRLNLAREEFQRRMRGNLCLKCAKPGHRANMCRSPSDNRDYTKNERKETKRNVAPWQRPTIREMEIDEHSETAGKDEGPQ